MHPLIWNLTRFHPFWALIEMTMGIVAARHVMLDTEEDKKKPTTPLQLKYAQVKLESGRQAVILIGRNQFRAFSRNPLWMFLAAYASLGLRLTQFDFNVRR